LEVLFKLILLGRKGKVYCSNAKQGNLLNSIIICLEEIKTALRIGLIQIHSKNETNTFEKIFWVQGCFEDYFLHTSKLHQHSVFFVNPQPLVLIPIYMNHF